jgi:NitT/TauT family transport system substrate-binding protein
MNKKWLVALVLLISVTVLPSGRSVAQEEVKIGYLKLVSSLPTYAALEEGYFQEQGLKITTTTFESGTLIIDALVAGRIDVSIGNSVVTNWMAEQNVPGTYKIFLIYGPTGPQDVTFTMMVSKDSALKEVIELKGKKVGTFPGIASLVLAKAVLRHSFDPDKEVTLVEVPPGNIVQALAAGQIDAYFAPEPFGMMGVAKGVARHLVKSPLSVLNLQKGFPGGTDAFNSKFLKEKLAVAKKVKGAIYRGADFIRSNEAEARKFLITYTGLPEPFAMKIPFEPWTKVEQYDKTAGQPYFDVLKKEGLFQKYVDTTRLYYHD